MNTEIIKKMNRHERKLLRSFEAIKPLKSTTEIHAAYLRNYPLRKFQSIVTSRILKYESGRLPDAYLTGENITAILKSYQVDVSDTSSEGYKMIHEAFVKSSLKIYKQLFSFEYIICRWDGEIDSPVTFG